MIQPMSRRAFLASSSAAGTAAISASALAGCETTAATPAGSPSAAPASAAFPAVVDTATRLDRAKAAGLRARGVRTVFRYYCHLPPSLPDKDITPAEAEIIRGEGLSLATVFQHYNNCFRTFENDWGAEDAERALEQASAIDQPTGSAIYFGVDGDWPYQEMIDPVIDYFAAVNAAFVGTGIAVGVYSNGCICDKVTELGLASYAWLSGSTAHTGTQAFYNLGRWSLFQNALDVTVGDGAAAVGVDTNLVNPVTSGYFGQFDARGARTAAHGDAETRAMLNARRFLAAAADIKAAPDAASATLTSLRKDRNVRVLESANGWSRVLTQEGGRRRGADGAPAEGWVPDAALTTMDAFADGTTAFGLCGSSRSPTDDYKYQNCAPATSRLR